MKKDDLDGIQELLSGKRYGYITSDSEEIRKTAQEHDFDVEIFPSYAVPQIVVAPHRTVGEIIKEVDLDVGISDIIGRTNRQYKIIKDFPITKALIYLQGINTLPEVDVLFGLLFGYKTCDIRYYVETRDFNKPKHKLEEVVDQQFVTKERTLAEQHVMCEACSEIYIETNMII